MGSALGARLGSPLHSSCKHIVFAGFVASAVFAATGCKDSPTAPRATQLVPSKSVSPAYTDADSAAAVASANGMDTTATGYDDAMGVDPGFASMTASASMMASSGMMASSSMVATDTQNPCTDTQALFNLHSGNFWRANSDFLDNLFTPYHFYLNMLAGGPLDVMKSELKYMKTYKDRYEMLSCAGK